MAGNLPVGKLKGIFDQGAVGRTAGGDINTDHIETGGAVNQLFFYQVFFGNPGNLLLFPQGHCLGGGPVQLAASGFYFGKHQRLAISADNINFSEFLPGVSRKDDMPSLREKTGRQLLTSLAKLLAVS